MVLKRFFFFDFPQSKTAVEKYVEKVFRFLVLDKIWKMWTIKNSRLLSCWYSWRKVEAVFHTVEKYVQNNSASQRCALYRLRSALAYIRRFWLIDRSDRYFLIALRSSKTVKTPAWVLNGYTLAENRLTQLRKICRRDTHFRVCRIPYISGSGKV